MIRKLKILGLSLVAFFAMSAMTASMASAVTHTPAVFHVENSAAEPATITGNQQTSFTFELTGQTTTCQVVKFEGTTNNPTPTSLRLALLTEQCGWASANATITNFAKDDSEIGQAGKCWYRLDADGSAALECNQAEVTIDAGTCIIHIPAQEFENAVSYETGTLVGGKHDLIVSFNLTGMTATHTDGFLCPFNGSGEGATAKFHGTSTAFAESEAGSELRHLTWTPTEADPDPDPEPLHLTHSPTVSGHTPSMFHVEKIPATITGTQKTTHTFELTERVATCEVIKFEGTTNEPTPTSIKMAAEYDKCFFAGISTTITNFAKDDSEIGKEGKCWYRLDADGDAGLECDKAEVTIDAATCQIHIPPQEFDSVVSYETETRPGGEHDLKVSFDVDGITANHTDGFLCPFSGSAEGATAKFHGTSTAFAETE